LFANRRPLGSFINQARAYIHAPNVKLPSIILYVPWPQGPCYYERIILSKLWISTWQPLRFVSLLGACTYHCHIEPTFCRDTVCIETPKVICWLFRVMVVHGRRGFNSNQKLVSRQSTAAYSLKSDTDYSVCQATSAKLARCAALTWPSPGDKEPQVIAPSRQLPPT
jgi:hypothetical protein